MVEVVSLGLAGSEHNDRDSPHAARPSAVCLCVNGDLLLPVPLTCAVDEAEGWGLPAVDLTRLSTKGGCGAEISSVVEAVCRPRTAGRSSSRNFRFLF